MTIELIFRFSIAFCLLLSVISEAATGSNGADLIEIGRHWQWSRIIKSDASGSGIYQDDFYLSREKTPTSELFALLKLLDNPMTHRKQLCKYPLRIAWLQGQQIENRFNLLERCSELATFMEHYRDAKIQLVFPTEFYDNPASMFGHMLMKISPNKNQTAEVLGFSYGGNVTDSVGFRYAFKGIFGYYQGFYSLAPYHRLLDKFNNQENRDIWEFDLDLNTHQTMLMLFQIWELRHSPTPYLFFSRNCASMLREFLSVFYRSLEFSQSKVWYFPMDLVHELNEIGVLITKNYTPSIGHRLKAIAEKVESKNQYLLADNDDDSINQIKGLLNQQKIHLLDYHSEALLARYHSSGQNRQRYAQRFLRLLTERSKLPAYSYSHRSTYELLESHRGSLIGFAIGSNGRVNLRLRPAFHGFKDHSAGYRIGNILSLLDLRLAFQNGVYIDSLEILHLAQLDDISKSGNSLSWELKSQWSRSNKLNSFAGIGYSYSLEETLFSFLAGPGLFYQEKLDPYIQLSLFARSQIDWLFLTIRSQLLSTETSRYSLIDLSLALRIDKDLSLSMINQWDQSTEKTYRIEVTQYF